MDRNTELASAGVPSVNRPRTTFKYNKRHMTTFNVGQLVPFYFNMLVQPGDTFSMSLSSFFRLTTSLFPSMDNLTADFYFFAIRWLNEYNHTKEFWGENRKGSWAPDTTYQLPGITIAPKDVIDKDTVLNHLGIPNLQADKDAGGTNARTENIWISRLGHNFYWDIVNEWFRDQNFIAPFEINRDDGDITFNTLGAMQKLFNVARFHDYFSAVVPESQKGDAELLPFSGGGVPVIGNGKTIGLTDGTNNYGLQGGWGGGEFLNAAAGNYGKDINTQNVTPRYTGNKTLGLTANPENSGMIADITNVVAATVNALRIVVVQQQIKERSAIFGTRFREIIKGRWGVVSPELANNIPEYLGGFRIPLNMDTVLQTSSTDSETPKGSPAGYSVTSDTSFLFTKSFDQWYMIMGLVCVRQDHTYAQGLNIQFQKKDPIDFWQPEYDNIGLQPIYKSEIFLSGKAATDNQVWGYRMPWQEYRQEVNEATGEMSPAAPTNLAYYNYADDYENAPTMSEEWLSETPDFVDRTLTVQSNKTHQLMMDTVLDITKVTEVSRFSIPGLDKF